MTTPIDARDAYYAGKVELIAQIMESGRDDGCEDGYRIEISRLDGEPLRELELRIILANTVLAMDGKDSQIDLARSS